MDGLELMVCFEKLEELMFFENRFSVFGIFPAYLTKIKNLKSLSFEGSTFSALPESIGDLTNLEQIDIQLKQQKTWNFLPESLFSLRKIQRISFRRIIFREALKERLNNLSFFNVTINIQESL